MALSLQLGYPDIPKSITNPTVLRQNALDVGDPLPFLTFIKIINISFEPDSLRDYYNYYITAWNNASVAYPNTNTATVINKYREFLKEISLNYTTLEEKQFLSKIDFTDPFDLDVAMGFYSKKLRELTEFYNQKRTDIKFNLTRNKLLGTNYGTSKSILEITLDYLKNLADGKILYDYDLIKSKIEIEIEELYDTYPIYFNQTPDPDIYDNKDLDYGYNIFLVPDTVTTTTLLSGFSQELQDLKEFDQLLPNKRALTEKYISTDFYYLSTGNTTSDYLSGKLFSADNTILNFINRNYPTTASTEHPEYLESERTFGFFRPHKQSIILIDGNTTEFSFNVDNLAPNSLYYFPDPTKIGENGGIMTFIVDDTHLKRNYSSGSATNQPYSTPYDTKYYGYVSKLEHNDNKFLDSVFDAGFISDIKRDIYNNTFGLFNNDHRFRQSIAPADTIGLPTPYSVIINGHKFFDTDYWEGYNFDFFAPDDMRYTETVRSGLSTTTAPLLLTSAQLTTELGEPILTELGEPIYIEGAEIPNISPSVDLILSFGYFSPNITFSTPTEPNITPSYETLEGAYITNYALVPYPEALSSDLSAFDVPFTSNLSSFFYDTLIDGGIYNTSPLQRGLNDVLYPAISSDLTKYANLSTIDVVDGGDIAGFFPELNIDKNNHLYIDTVTNTTQYILSTFPIIDGYELNGNIMVRDANTKMVAPLLEALPYLTVKYPPAVISELESNILEFDIVVDTLIIKTPSYLTFNKLIYANGTFADSRANTIYITHSDNSFNKISNRFKKDTDIYYCSLSTYGDVNSNTLLIYPQIYRFDYINNINYQIFPSNSTDITNNAQFFTISGGDVRYTAIDTPILTYSSRPNLFNISFLLKDQNNMFSIHNIDFGISTHVSFYSNVNYFPTVDNTSNIFTTLSTINVFLSAGNITLLDEELSI